jgi:hypothetical protein
MFNILAELSEEELERLYELTYKYGWLVADERQHGGWLPDRAYMEKAKIEDTLRTVTHDALQGIIDTYNDWLGFHTEEGWINSMREVAEDSMAALEGALAMWNLTIDEDLIFASVADDMGDPENFLYENEDHESLRESYGEAFVDYLIDKGAISDNIAEKIDAGEIDPEDYIGEDRMDELIEWIVEVQGWNIKDYLKEIYTVSDIMDNYPHAVLYNLDAILKDAYRQYLDHFYGLEDEIEEIARVKDELEEALDEEDLNKQSIAFQLGLNTAHHHGTMADHLLGVTEGTGEGILDNISSGPNLATWNKELAQVLGHPIEAKMKIGSVIDYIRDGLDDEIWDTTGEEVTLQENINNEVLDVVFSALDDLDLPQEALTGLFIYGSILSNQYNANTDVDCRIVLDPETVYEKYGDGTTGDALLDLTFDIVHGELLGNTQHPFNCTIIIEGEKTELGQAELGKTKEDPVYDVLTGSIVVDPVYKEDYDPDEKFTEERDEVDVIMADLDTLIRETKTDTIDFQWLQDAVTSVKDKEKFEEKIDRKLEELEADIEALVGEYRTVKDDRTDAYEEGDGHADPRNVKFKYLEKYKYIDTLRALKRLLKEGIQESEVDDVAEVLNI